MPIDGEHHVVGFENLPVVIVEDHDCWFAQGLDIDYASQAAAASDRWFASVSNPSFICGIGQDSNQMGAATLERRPSTHKFNQLRPFGLWLAIA
jgi:hypothetical protein